MLIFVRIAAHSILLILLMTPPAYGDTWDEGEGIYFQNGDISAVKHILSQSTYKGEALIYAFLTAVSSGNVDLVRYLETRGWGKNCLASEDCDPLFYAVVSQKHPKMVAYLLSRNYNPTTAALKSAALMNTPGQKEVAAAFESVVLLCAQGANPAKVEKNKDGTMEPSVIDKLADRINSPRLNMGTPTDAARGTAAETILLKFFKSDKCKRGKVDTDELSQFMALSQSLRNGTLTPLQLPILEAARSIPQIETYLLYEAIRSGKIALLEQLKQLSIISRCLANSRCRPFNVAAEAGVSREIFQYLADQNFEIDPPSNYGESPLMYAVLNAEVEAVRFLCERGADYRKQVKLDVSNRSIISILRRQYGYTWASIVMNGGNGASAAQIAKNDCTYGGSLLRPQDEMCASECIPGSTCKGISFPPNGRATDIRKLTDLRDIFLYLKDGHCQSDRCTRNVSRNAAIIGNGVHLRDGPSTGREKLKLLQFGTVVEVLDNSRSCEPLAGSMGRWIKVNVLSYPNNFNEEHPKIEGWLFDTYVDYFFDLRP